MIIIPRTDILIITRTDRHSWAKDLENSSLKQCKHVLFDGTGYCCLGRAQVCLGDSSDKQLFNISVPSQLDDLTVLFYDGGLLENMLVASKRDKDISYNFQDLNDIVDLTFPQIAALLRFDMVNTEDKKWKQ